MSHFDSAMMDEDEPDMEPDQEAEKAYWFNLFAIEQQADLPEHQRDGYVERIMEIADQRRKELKENGK
jgi:hypothetical protein